MSLDSRNSQAATRTPNLRAINRKQANRLESKQEKKLQLLAQKFYALLGNWRISIFIRRFCFQSNEGRMHLRPNQRLFDWRSEINNQDLTLRFATRRKQRKKLTRLLLVVSLVARTITETSSSKQFSTASLLARESAMRRPANRGCNKASTQAMQQSWRVG